ncbi:MAG: hypothetical protein K2X77_18485 [Candidatus Obscuribacterales bacterium]|jgi:hypothetical protein|nr:hypothetical protein [Candidatus Obscuribacterales bacterium]
MSYQKYIAKVLQVLQEILLLQRTEILLSVDSCTCDADSYAVTEQNPRYDRATIHVGASLRKEYDEGNLERVHKTLIHEMVHIITMEVTGFGYQQTSPQTNELYSDKVERLTEHLTRVLHNLLPKKTYEV